MARRLRERRVRLLREEGLLPGRGAVGIMHKTPRVRRLHAMAPLLGQLPSRDFLEDFMCNPLHELL